MEMYVQVKEEVITLIELRTLVAKKAIMRQIEMKSGLINEDFINMQIIGWMDGPTFDKEIYGKVGLFTINDRPYLIKLSTGGWSKEFIKSFTEKPQIILI